MGCPNSADEWEDIGVQSSKSCERFIGRFTQNSYVGLFKEATQRTPPA